MDDGQHFGRPERLDGEAAVRELLGGKPITRAYLDRVTADKVMMRNGNGLPTFDMWKATVVRHCPLRLATPKKKRT